MEEAVDELDGRVVGATLVDSMVDEVDGLLVDGVLVEPGLVEELGGVLADADGGSSSPHAAIAASATIAPIIEPRRRSPQRTLLAWHRSKSPGTSDPNKPSFERFVRIQHRRLRAIPVEVVNGWSVADDAVAASGGDDQVARPRDRHGQCRLPFCHGIDGR